MPMSRRVIAVLACTALTVVAGCTGKSTPTPAGPERSPVALQWREVALPTPAGPPGRLMVRDVISCGGQWYITGAVIGADGLTRPAAWRSSDGATWTPLGFRFTADSYYGKRSIVYAAGCRDGRLAAIGAKSGGAHGNPRVRTWSQLPDGSMTEVDADFEVYGGPNAVSVDRIAGGPRGWLIAGTRVGGAAVWTSPDATGFQVLEGLPELASDARGRTWAADAVADPSGWTVVGGIGAAERGGADPMVWVSADGRHWRRVAVPADRVYDELHRVAATTAGMIAVGIRGGAFGAWLGANGSWRTAGRFGATGGPSAAGVDGVAVADDLTLVATHATDGHLLWSTNSAAAAWTPVALPTPVPTNGDTAMTVALKDNLALLVTDDGRSGRAWTALLHPGG